MSCKEASPLEGTLLPGSTLRPRQGQSRCRKGQLEHSRDAQGPPEALMARGCEAKGPLKSPGGKLGKVSVDQRRV